SAPTLLGPNHTLMRPSTFPFHFLTARKVSSMHSSLFSHRPSGIAPSSTPKLGRSITDLPKTALIPDLSTTSARPSNPYLRLMPQSQKPIIPFLMFSRQFNAIDALASSGE